MNAYHQLGLLKQAMNRREAIALLLKNTVGGAAVGSTYKAGLRPAVRNLSHEVAHPDVIRGANMGPFSGAAVGPDDLKAWDAARSATSEKLTKGVDWGREEPSKQIGNAMNRAGYSALSDAGASAAESRFFKREAVGGAVGGGALAGGATVIQQLLKELKALTKGAATSDNSMNSYHLLNKEAARGDQLLKTLRALAARTAHGTIESSANAATRLDRGLNFGLQRGADGANDVADLKQFIQKKPMRGGSRMLTALTGRRGAFDPSYAEKLVNETDPAWLQKAPGWNNPQTYARQILAALGKGKV